MSKAIAALLELSPDPMVVVSGELIIVSANTAFRTMADSAADGPAGRSLASVFGNPEAELRDAVERCCRTSASLPFAMLLKDETGQWVRHRADGLLLERGLSKAEFLVGLRVKRRTGDEVHGFHRLNQELTQLRREILARQEAERALREGEARLGGIISSAMDAIITVDARQVVTDFNNAAERMFGCPAAEAIGGPIDRFIPDRFRAGHAAHIETFSRTQVTKRQMGALGTIHGRRVAGEEFPIEASISQLQTQAGKFYTVILRDVTERKEAETALRLSEARYRNLIHALPAAVYTCDQDGRITLYNQAAKTLWGWKPEIGKDRWCGSSNIYRPDGTPMTFEEWPIVVALREGRPIVGQEVILERPDGGKRHVIPHPEPIKDERGEVVGVINMLVDITDRKEAERGLANLAAIVTSSDDAIVGKNLLGIVTSWNRAAEQLFGYTAEEMIGQPVSRLIPPNRQDEEPEILKKLARGEPIHHYETVRRRKDGRDLHVSLSVSPVIDSHGRIIGGSKIARDITEQKRTERALLESREELRHALEYQESVVSNMGEGLYTVDGRGLVTSVNQAAERLFGWTREELIGRKMHDVTHYMHRDGAPFSAEECAVLQVLRHGAPLTNYEDVFIRKDGSFFDVVYSSSPIWTGGKIAGLVVVFRDVSDKKQADEALQERDRALTTANEALTKQTAALAEANKELESFSYSVSHDLRAPLRTIDGFTRIVIEEHAAHLDAEAHRCLDIVRKAAGRAGELIDDLLELSRLGRQTMQWRSVDMAGAAREAADEARRLLEGRTIEFIAGDLPACQGDGRLLKLVWANLVENAFKYTQYLEAARIETGWMPDDTQADAVVYYIKDNGVGFDMKYAHKLFGVFQRLHNKSEFDGTGVGLAIVHRIIQRHGGRVWAEGKVDGGATFYFSLRKAMA